MRMVVKVQAPMFMVGGGLSAYLVYNEDRSFHTLLPMGEYAPLDDAMRSNPKRFFLAEVSNSNDDTEIDFDFDTHCEDPGW